MKIFSLGWRWGEDPHINTSGILVRKFKLTPKEINLGVTQALFDP